MFEYSLTYFDEVDQKERKVNGFVVAESWSAAMSKLADFYGDDCLMEVYVAGISDNDLGVMEYISGVTSIKNYLLV